MEKHIAFLGRSDAVVWKISLLKSPTVQNCLKTGHRNEILKFYVDIAVDIKHVHLGSMNSAYRRERFNLNSGCLDETKAALKSNN